MEETTAEETPGDSANQESASNQDSQNEDSASNTASTGGGIDVDKGLLNVEINISAESAEFYGITFESQEEADAYAKEQGFKSVTLNEDGSVTFVMSKSKHKEFMSALKESLDESVKQTVESESYPNFIAIEHNDDFTEFKITTKSEELDFNETFSVLGFYILGGMYNQFNGTPADNVHIDFINEETGEVIDSYDSKNLGESGDGSEDTADEESKDSADYAAQLEKTEYVYDTGFGATMHFVVIKNNSDQTLTVSTNSVAYNENGDKIGAASGSLDAIGPGNEQVVIEYFDSVSDVDHFETSISASKSKWYEDATEYIEVEADILEDKVILTCTNIGEKAVDFPEGRVLFMKDGECIGYDTQYFTDEESELKPGQSITKQFDCYGDSMDDAKYYIHGWIKK